MRLSVREVAEMFRVSENTVARWVRSDSLPANSVGGEFRFSVMQVLEWATLHDVTISEGFVHVLDGDAPAVPNLAEALEAGGILHRVSGPDKAAIAKEIVEALVLPPGFDRESLRTMLLARDNLGCSPIGDGIAIPHPRFPLILPLERPAMTLCFLQNPLSSSESPTRTIDTLFLLVSPTVSCHLSLLARLGAALHDLEFRDLIKRRHSHDHIFRAAHRLQNFQADSADVAVPYPGSAH
jgi:nitrogen PTS system EIIA component